jgi:hypothetical protein
MSTKTKTKAPTADTLGRLIDRHGEDCGYVMYSPYFSNETILCLSDEAPRAITLETWERWGKQAKSFRKAAESVLKAKKVVKKAAKKTKKVTKKVAKK